MVRFIAADFRKMSSDKNLTGFENLSGLGQNIYLKAAAINRAMQQRSLAAINRAMQQRSLVAQVAQGQK